MQASTLLAQGNVCRRAASAAEGGGKNTDLSLLAYDLDRGTLDPAFDAHVLPLKFWAHAVWERWRSPDELEAALQNVRAKIDCARCTWSVATGPVAALLNSLWRIGWDVHSHDKMSDDRGNFFNLNMDPPVVVTRAVEESVRRWRLARIARGFTCLHDFTFHRRSSQGEVTHLLRPDVADISKPLRRVIAGSSDACKHARGWSSTHSSLLVSVFSVLAV